MEIEDELVKQSQERLKTLAARLGLGHATLRVEAGNTKAEILRDRRGRGCGFDRGRQPRTPRSRHSGQFHGRRGSACRSLRRAGSAFEVVAAWRPRRFPRNEFGSMSKLRTSRSNPIHVTSASCSRTRSPFAMRAACPARLLTRHWIITDANGNVKETRGDGVSGGATLSETRPGVSLLQRAPSSKLRSAPCRAATRW